MRQFFAAAAVAAIAFTGAASADFFEGQGVAINGTAGPQFATAWGTAEGQGLHNLGGFTQYFDPFFTQFTIDVSSTVNVGSVSFLISFSDFAPGDFSTHTVDILGLKADGTIEKVISNLGNISTNGNDVSWIGTGAELALEPDLEITVFQIPTPGALALIGVAGLVARRRRA